MKTLNYVASILLMGVFLCTACSKDEDVLQEPTEDVAEIQRHQLKYLQESIVRVDSVGNVLSRPLGVMLNDADTTILSVGVKNIEEATELFKTLFTEEQAFKQSGQTLSTEIADGSVAFSPVSGSHILARAIFDVPSLYHISKIDFILQSAWPVNTEESAFKFGDVITKECNTGGNYRKNVTLVCIREYTPGVNGIMVGQTNGEWSACGMAWDNSYPASRADANLVAGIMSSNWSMYTDLWTSKGVSPALSDSYLWIGDSSFFKGRYAINLMRNKYDYWSILGNHRARELVVQYFQTIK